MALSGRLGVLEGCRALRALDLGRVRLSLPFCIEAWLGLAHSQSRQFLLWFVLEARWSLPLLGFAIALLPYTWSFSGGLCSVLSLWVLLEWELVEGAASLLTPHCCVLAETLGGSLVGCCWLDSPESGVSGRWCGPPACLSCTSEADRWPSLGCASSHQWALDFLPFVTLDATIRVPGSQESGSTQGLVHLHDLCLSMDLSWWALKCLSCWDWEWEISWAVFHISWTCERAYGLFH